jgi:glycosyltransferase involved in cell wall biosynthesis
MPERPASVAYILKAYPRLSETYIHSEILRVEQAGLPVRLYALKPLEALESGPPHPVVERIRARPVHLPATTSVSSVSLARWLGENGPRFAGPLARAARRRPLGLARAGAAAFGQAVRARKGRLAWPRKVYLKELLQAVALSDELRRAPDVAHLHAHYAHGTATVAWLAAKITGLSFSFTAHAKDVYSEELNPAGLLRRKLLAARFAVTCTGANAVHLRGLAPQADVHVVYHGLNDDLARLASNGGAAAVQAARPTAPLHLLGVGRLVEKKGFDTLVEACAELRRRGVPFRATIAGPDGPFGAVVRERIAGAGLEDAFALPGSMTQAELFGLYTGASAFVLPCRVVGTDRDGIPNVMVEAMACGTPVVSTPISGIPELVTDGEDGLLVPPADPGALADALERLHAEPALVGRLGASARDTVRERFDGERTTRRLVGLFAAELGR